MANNRNYWKKYAFPVGFFYGFSCKTLKIIFTVFGLAGCLFLTACQEPPQEESKEVIRRIKHMTLKLKPTNQARVIAGVVSPVVQTNVSFEIAGQIQKLNVSVGDRIKKGDIIAELDPQTYELNLQSAEGALKSAQASLADANKKFVQQSELYKKKFTTKTNYDTALATLESAKSQVSIEQSRVDIAKRDLKKTKLRAPFDGAISEKSSDVFEEVTAGKTIVVLHTEGNFEVDVSVPETLVNEIHVGDQVELKLSLGEGAPFKGYIKDIGSQAGQANAFPATIALNEKVAGLRPGMSVEVTFEFAQNQESETFNVPLSAVTPSESPDKEYMFVFNKDKQYVERRDVTVVNIRDNLLIVKGNVKEGDIVATAGLSFLVDKMPVRLMNGK